MAASLNGASGISLGIADVGAAGHVRPSIYRCRQASSPGVGQRHVAVIAAHETGVSGVTASMLARVGNAAGLHSFHPNHRR